jgi:transcription elongation GreA/GreB family factor
MPGSDEAPTVEPGSTVRIREADGLERVVRIRDTGSASWAVDSVPMGTSLARALMGHKAGDVVEVEVHPVLPVRSVVIVAVE